MSSRVIRQGFAYTPKAYMGWKRGFIRLFCRRRCTKHSERGNQVCSRPASTSRCGIGWRARGRSQQHISLASRRTGVRVTNTTEPDKVLWDRAAG